MTKLPAIPDPPQYPAEYHDRQSNHVSRRLARLSSLEPAARAVEMRELRAVLRSMKVTESRAEVEVLEARLAQVARRLGH